MTSATSNSTFTSWVEDPAFGDDAPLPRLAHAQVTFSFEGDLTGSSECRYVLSYGADGNGICVGFERISGTLHGMTGSFVVRDEADFTAADVTTRFEVVAGSGTGALAGISGSGSYRAGHGASSWVWTFDYEIT